MFVKKDNIDERIVITNNTINKTHVNYVCI